MRSIAAVGAATPIGYFGPGPPLRWGFEEPRPISLLRVSLLRFVDSNFPGDVPWTWEFHPLNLRFRLSQTL